MGEKQNRTDSLNFHEYIPTDMNRYNALSYLERSSKLHSISEKPESLGFDMISSGSGGQFSWKLDYDLTLKLVQCSEG